MGHLWDMFLTFNIYPTMFSNPSKSFSDDLITSWRCSSQVHPNPLKSNSIRPKTTKAQSLGTLKFRKQMMKEHWKQVEAKALGLVSRSSLQQKSLNSCILYVFKRNKKQWKLAFPTISQVKDRAVWDFNILETHRCLHMLFTWYPTAFLLMIRIFRDESSLIMPLLQAWPNAPKTIA